MFKTIRTRMLFGFGLLLTVSLSLLGAFLYLQVERTVVPLTHELSQEVLRARSAGLGNLFKGYLNDVRTQSRDAVIRTGNPVAIRHELASRQADNNPDYEMVFFAGADGNYVSSIGSAGYVGDRGYFKAIMLEGKNEVIGEPITSRATGATVFVIAAAVVNPQGQRIGVFAATVLLDTLTEIAGAIGIGSQGFGWVMDHQGLLIAHPSETLRMKLNLIESAAQGYQGLDRIGQALSRGESGVGAYHRPEGSVFSTIYTPIPNTPNWGLGVSLQQSTLMAHAEGLLQAILWGLVLVTGLVLSLVFVLSGKITAPLHQLMAGVAIVGTGRLDHKLNIRTGDEIQTLALAFNHMTDDLQTQMRDLATVTAAKARVDGELQVAHNIQMDLVPKTFPAYPHRNDIDLCAMIVPAREVGGDFYDFFLIGDDRLVLAIGDVSGKGVPAALFMAVTRSFLRAEFKVQDDPGKALTRVNEALAESNDSCMFVTLFCAVIHLDGGRIAYSNAGHNLPVLLRGQALSWMPAPPGTVAAGVMPGIEYDTLCLDMQVDDALLLYTDGVTEAMSPASVLYGDAQLLACLTAAGQKTCEATLAVLYQDVLRHAAGADQSDDITTLMFRWVRPTTRAGS